MPVNFLWEDFEIHVRGKGLIKAKESISDGSKGLQEWGRS